MNSHPLCGRLDPAHRRSRYVGIGACFKGNVSNDGKTLHENPQQGLRVFMKTIKLLHSKQLLSLSKNRIFHQRMNYRGNLESKRKYLAKVVLADHRVLDGELDIHRHIKHFDRPSNK
jgi:hypothetical protein